MRKKIISTTCVLLGLFSSLHLCSGKFGTPITDDVSKLSVLKQNIPSDYEIPVSYIPKEVAGACWVVLNIYPLERSLEKLASMFGAVSSNRDDINVFITMLKSLRLTFDHEELETAMQVFQCHYREKSLLSGLYFDYIQDLLRAATQGTSSLSCKPQPCLDDQQRAEGQEESRKYRWLKSSSLLLVLIPFTACIVLIVWREVCNENTVAEAIEAEQVGEETPGEEFSKAAHSEDKHEPFMLKYVKSGRNSIACNTSNGQTASPDTIPTVSVSIPLQTLTHADDSQPTGEAISEHESG